ncbi:MAG TPA: hypothetical protein VMJ49_07230, partial [Gaiellaceae bacterium]|nr:hypothetical protein [Gaiellaceae bacterium]
MSTSTNMWSFPEGSVGHDQSCKGYEVDGTDGPVGTVSWCDYAPGEAYLVVSYKHHLKEKHHVVPAGAVARVDHEQRVVTLTVTKAEVEASPE